MDKYEKLIIRHESARKNVQDLKLKRSELLKHCENVEEVESSPGSGYFFKTGKICLNKAYDELMEAMDEDLSEGYQVSGYSYKEILEDMHCQENICEHCYESYKIKIGSLADAKKEFGNAKRAIYHAGKKLINNK